MSVTSTIKASIPTHVKVMAVLVLLLILSITGNVGLLYKLDTANDERDLAQAAASRCSASVDQLSKTSEKQLAAIKAELDAAKKATKAAQAKALAELNREPAVPGNVCESAKVETDEWLAKRRAR